MVSGLTRGQRKGRPFTSVINLLSNLWRNHRAIHSSHEKKLLLQEKRCPSLPFFFSPLVTCALKNRFCLYHVVETNALEFNQGVTINRPIKLLSEQSHLIVSPICPVTCESHPFTLYMTASGPFTILLGRTLSH